MRLVLDTSVLISAVRSPLGASRVLLVGAFHHRFDLLISTALMLEYESILLRNEQREASGLSPAQIERLLLDILSVAIKVNPGWYRGPGSSDPGDDHLLKLASSGQADAIVTHNLRHFIEPCKSLGVNLFTPGEALSLLRS